MTAKQRSSLRPSIHVTCEVGVPLQLRSGAVAIAFLTSFANLSDDGEHFCARFGSPNTPAPLVRIHSECVTGDALRSMRCDCGPQLDESIERLNNEGGYLLYLRQEGRGIGLFNKLKAYALQDVGYDTYAANLALGRGHDERDYRVAAEMLEAIGVQSVRLLSNNPDKTNQLINLGIDVREQVNTGFHLVSQNRNYLNAKRRYGHHLPELVGESLEEDAG